MQIQPISDWQAHITAGRRYLETATNGRARPDVFNNELTFQLAAMAIEKLIVGLSQRYQRMPDDHTLSGLVAGLASVCPLDLALAGRIAGIEAVDDMCALTAARRPPPKDADIDEILAVGRALAHFVDRHVHRNECASATA